MEVGESTHHTHLTTTWSEVLPKSILTWLQNDSNAQRGYRNCVHHPEERDPQKIDVRHLVVDGEICKHLKHTPQVEALLHLANNGPWLTEVRATLGLAASEYVHVCSIEVHMHGRLTDGVVHVDDLVQPVSNVVIPLNDSYFASRGGCTCIRTASEEHQRLECGENSAVSFDGSMEHFRTAAQTQDWADKRRLLFIVYTKNAFPWVYMKIARRLHCPKSKLPVPVRTVSTRARGIVRKDQRWKNSGDEIYGNVFRAFTDKDTRKFTALACAPPLLCSLRTVESTTTIPSYTIADRSGHEVTQQLV